MKIFNILFLFLFFTGLIISCGGSDDSNDNNGNTSVKQSATTDSSTTISSLIADVGTVTVEIGANTLSANTNITVAKADAIADQYTDYTIEAGSSAISITPEITTVILAKPITATLPLLTNLLVNSSISPDEIEKTADNLAVLRISDGVQTILYPVELVSVGSGQGAKFSTISFGTFQVIFINAEDARTATTTEGILNVNANAGASFQSIAAFGNNNLYAFWRETPMDDIFNGNNYFRVYNTTTGTWSVAQDINIPSLTSSETIATIVQYLSYGASLFAPITNPQEPINTLPMLGFSSISEANSNFSIYKYENSLWSFVARKTMSWFSYDNNTISQSEFFRSFGQYNNNIIAIDSINGMDTANNNYYAFSEVYLLNTSNGEFTQIGDLTGFDQIFTGGNLYLDNALCTGDCYMRYYLNGYVLGDTIYVLYYEKFQGVFKEYIYTMTNSKSNPGSWTETSSAAVNINSINLTGTINYQVSNDTLYLNYYSANENATYIKSCSAANCNAFTAIATMNTNAALIWQGGKFVIANEIPFLLLGYTSNNNKSSEVFLYKYQNNNWATLRSYIDNCNGNSQLTNFMIDYIPGKLVSTWQHKCSLDNYNSPSYTYSPGDFDKFIYQIINIE